MFSFAVEITDTVWFSMRLDSSKAGPHVAPAGKLLVGEVFPGTINAANVIMLLSLGLHKLVTFFGQAVLF